MPRKPFLYSVMCRVPVANEMCRYENATILTKQLVQASPLTDKTYDDDLYSFEISSPNFVPLRWKSFGVMPVLH